MWDSQPLHSWITFPDRLLFIFAKQTRHHRCWAWLVCPWECTLLERQEFGTFNCLSSNHVRFEPDNTESHRHSASLWPFPFYAWTSNTPIAGGTKTWWTGCSANEVNGETHQMGGAVFIKDQTGQWFTLHTSNTWWYRIYSTIPEDRKRRIVRKYWAKVRPKTKQDTLQTLSQMACPVSHSIQLCWL